MTTPNSVHTAAIVFDDQYEDTPQSGVASNEQISAAFTARGNAFLANGEYHLAVRAYGIALNHAPTAEDGSPNNSDAYNNRLDALLYQWWFFRAKGNPDHPDPTMPAWARDAIRKAKVPHGHLVVVGDENILVHFPLTPEGREEAVVLADQLADTSDLRIKIDNCYLAESDEFDTAVYSYDGTNLEEMHRARARDEHGSFVRD